MLSLAEGSLRLPEPCPSGKWDQTDGWGRSKVVGWCGKVKGRGWWGKSGAQLLHCKLFLPRCSLVALNCPGSFVLLRAECFLACFGVQCLVEKGKFWLPVPNAM